MLHLVAFAHNVVVVVFDDVAAAAEAAVVVVDISFSVEKFLSIM